MTFLVFSVFPAPDSPLCITRSKCKFFLQRDHVFLNVQSWCSPSLPYPLHHCKEYVNLVYFDLKEKSFTKRKFSLLYQSFLRIRLTTVYRINIEFSYFDFKTYAYLFIKLYCILVLNSNVLFSSNLPNQVTRYLVMTHVINMDWFSLS